jgi:hypothetical protein
MCIEHRALTITQNFAFCGDYDEKKSGRSRSLRRLTLCNRIRQSGRSILWFDRMSAMCLRGAVELRYRDDIGPVLARLNTA